MLRFFLAHSATDLDVATTLQERLRAQRLFVHLGKPDLRPGEALWGGVQEAIQRCDAVVFLVTRTASITRHAVFEAGVARKHGKTFLAILYADAALAETEFAFLDDSIDAAHRFALADLSPPAVASLAERLAAAIDRTGRRRPRRWWQRWWPRSRPRAPRLEDQSGGA